MELKGLKGGGVSCSFNQFNDVAVALSKYGVVSIWNVKVQYELSEDPKLIYQFTLPE